MKKNWPILNPYDHFPALNEIGETLRKVPLLKQQTPLEVSVFNPSGIFLDLKDAWFKAHIERRLEKKLLKYSFFDLFSSVVIIFLKKLKDPLLIFKKLGRTPGELLIHIHGGSEAPFVYPFLVYWKGKLKVEFPKALLKQYPLAATSLFWTRLDKYSGIEEIPLKLIKNEQIKTKNIVYVRHVLRLFKLISDERRGHKSFSEETQKLVWSIYLKDRPDRSKRYPVDQIQGKLAKQMKDTSSKAIPSKQTIRRSIDEYWMNKDAKLQQIKQEEFQRAYSKDFMKILKSNGEIFNEKVIQRRDVF